MTQTLQAVFDGKVFQPKEPVKKLQANTPVELVVRTLAPKKGRPYSLFDLAASLKLKGPPDWSEHLDDYLYHGKPI